MIAAFAKALLAGQRPTIYGDGTQTRDFTFVHNAVHANLLAARRAEPITGEVLNVGTGGQVSVNALAAMMGQMLKKPELTPQHVPERAGDLKHSYADLVKTRKVLGYEPIVDFAPGLEETVTWYATMTGAYSRRSRSTAGC